MQISNKNKNGLLPMQYVFLIRCRAGCKKYVTRLRLVTYLIFITVSAGAYQKHVGLLHGQESVSILLLSCCLGKIGSGS